MDGPLACGAGGPGAIPAATKSRKNVQKFRYFWGQCIGVGLPLLGQCIRAGLPLLGHCIGAGLPLLGQCIGEGSLFWDSV